jgi:hypothetical protein
MIAILERVVAASDNRHTHTKQGSGQQKSPHAAGFLSAEAYQACMTFASLPHMRRFISVEDTSGVRARYTTEQ